MKKAFVGGIVVGVIGFIFWVLSCFISFVFGIGFHIKVEENKTEAR